MCRISIIQIFMVFISKTLIDFHEPKHGLGRLFNLVCIPRYYHQCLLITFLNDIYVASYHELYDAGKWLDLQL